MSLILTLWRQSQANLWKFKISQGCIVRAWRKSPKKKQTKKPTTGTGEVALQIRVLTATVLDKDTHLVPSTHIGGGVVYNP